MSTLTKNEVCYEGEECVNLKTVKKQAAEIVSLKREVRRMARYIIDMEEAEVLQRIKRSYAREGLL